MTGKRHLLITLIIIMLFLMIGCAGLSNIHINEISQNYELDTPGKKLFLTIPKGELTLRDLRDDNLRDYETSPRFYYLENRKSNLIITCWFEPEEQFPGINKFWDDEIEGWRRAGLPSPQDVSFNEIGKWDAIIYEIRSPNSTKSYVNAHWIQEGTWIEIVLSMPSSSPGDESRSNLIETLKTIQVKEIK
jgi:hypothetical protein